MLAQLGSIPRHKDYLLKQIVSFPVGLDYFGRLTTGVAINKIVRGLSLNQGGKYFLFSGKNINGITTWNFYALRQFGIGPTGTNNETLLPDNFTFIQCNGIEIETPGQTVFGAVNYPANDLQIGTWFETEPNADESVDFPIPEYLDPRTIEDCFIWMRAQNWYSDENNTFIWEDSTVNNNDFAQAGVGAKPIYHQYLPELNYSPALEFNDNQYVFSLTPHSFANVQVVSIYVAFSPALVPAGEGNFYGQISSQNKFRYIQSGSFIEAGYLSGSGGEGGNLETLWTGSRALQIDNAYVGSAVYRVASSTGNYFSGKMKLNGKSLIGEYKQVNEPAGPGIIGTAVAIIGEGVRIGEIIIYKRELTAAEDTSVTNYLAGKYNVA